MRYTSPRTRRYYPEPSREAEMLAEKIRAAGLTPTGKVLRMAKAGVPVADIREAYIATPADDRRVWFV